MKAVVVLACCVVCVIGSPTFPTAAPTPVSIIFDERDPIDAHGGYGYRFQTGNGITQSESHGPTGFLGKMSTKGGYSFTHPDGTLHELSYTADERGFLPSSDLLPTPHPLTHWQKEQVRFAEQQRRLKALADARAALEALL
ncbi:cuticle protein AM1199-like [Homarus americanus]|uniref:cuticle protein AM1199-like n=1 Tax=Homarus americanus TaxID=6706 RepID=UPI001C44D2BC|nr:cuticle protein AM1199-like [Homarus americanus]